MKMFPGRLSSLVGMRTIARLGFEIKMFILFVCVLIILSYIHFAKNDSTEEPKTIAQKIVYTNCMIEKANVLLENGLTKDALVLYNRALVFGYCNDPKIYEPALKFYIRQPPHSWADFMLYQLIVKGHIELVFEDPLSQKRYDEILQNWKSKKHLLKPIIPDKTTDNKKLEQAKRWLEHQMANKEFYERHFARPKWRSDNVLVRNHQRALFLSEKY